MKKLTASLSMFALLFALLGAVPSPASAQSILPLDQIKSGDLVRGESLPAVYYYGKDGFRYVFPNDKTYFTWYENFDSVKWISDADLAKLQIGGNVTYKPGVKMVKINTDTKTYAIDEGGLLRWVKTEAAAIALYGENWNQMIDDVPDAFFANYLKNGEPIESLSDYNPELAEAAAANINEDKGLQSPIVIQIDDNQFIPSEVNVERGRAIKFINNDTVKHAATETESLKWGTGTLQPGEAFSRYFEERGTHNYFDNYNPEVTGSIVVN